MLTNKIKQIEQIEFRQTLLRHFFSFYCAVIKSSQQCINIKDNESSINMLRERMIDLENKIQALSSLEAEDFTSKLAECEKLFVSTLNTMVDIVSKDTRISAQAERLYTICGEAIQDSRISGTDLKKVIATFDADLHSLIPVKPEEILVLGPLLSKLLQKDLFNLTHVNHIIREKIRSSKVLNPTNDAEVRDYVIKNQDEFLGSRYETINPYRIKRAIITVIDFFHIKINEKERSYILNYFSHYDKLGEFIYLLAICSPKGNAECTILNRNYLKLALDLLNKSEEKFWELFNKMPTDGNFSNMLGFLGKLEEQLQSESSDKKCLENTEVDSKIKPESSNKGCCVM